MRHNFTPRDTVHQSVSLALAAPGGEVLVRAELFRLDELSDVGDTGLWIEGATSVELGGPEGNIFLAQGQAFLDGVRILLAQMGDAG